jgi:hypothetical protein
MTAADGTIPGRAMRGALAVLLAAVACAGCAAGRARRVTYHDPSMDFSLVQKVAVLPFTNLTPNGNAADRLRDTFMTMMQAAGSVYLIPVGEVGRGISRANLANPTAPTAEEIVQLAKIVEADAVITGTVREYGEVRSGTASGNVVALSVEMLEGQTGRVVWSASSSKGGITAGDRFFGGGGEPMNVVTEEAVRDLLDKLFDLE